MGFILDSGDFLVLNNYLINADIYQKGIFYLQQVLEETQGYIDQKKIVDAINLLHRLHTCKGVVVKEVQDGE